MVRTVLTIASIYGELLQINRDTPDQQVIAAYERVTAVVGLSPEHVTQRESASKKAPHGKRVRQRARIGGVFSEGFIEERERKRSPKGH